MFTAFPVLIVDAVISALTTLVNAIDVLDVAWCAKSPDGNHHLHVAALPHGLYLQHLDQWYIKNNIAHGYQHQQQYRS
jgi:hypothetical protein